MNKIIKELISVHKEESILSKKLKKLKEDVRAYMQKNNVSSITVDDGEVIIKEVEQTSFDEDRLITWLEENHPECLTVKTVIDYDYLDNAIKAFKEEKGRNPYIMMNKFTFEKFYNRDITILTRTFSADTLNLRGRIYTQHLYFNNEIFITSSIGDGNVELF